MNTQQLLGWMNDPASAGKDAGAQLESLTQTFPYFQTAHLLLIKSLHNQNSFLYNNQLKIAAAYATNRKVLYELITKKGNGNGNGIENGIESGNEQKSEVQSSKFEIESSKSEVGNANTESAAKTEIAAPKEPETVQQETAIIQPEFPKKRFVSNPDEWEAGMLRQLQLLHHWKTSPAAELKKLQQEAIKKTQPEIPQEKTEELKNVPVETEAPTAADEINTLLYVLVEPDGAEDIVSENETTEITEEPQNWEIKIIREEPEAVTEPAAEIIAEKEEAEETAVAVPDDIVHQEMMLEAISSTIELEVDDVLPKPEELIPVSQRPAPEIVKTEPEKEEKTVSKEEIQEPVSGGEMSFSGWLQNLSQAPKPEPKPEPKIIPEIAASTEPVVPNSLIDKFIQEQPRIKAQKNSFYSPVNMAKKSVQENDEFITETLARIYVKQGNISKAIRSYQKLSLKFPEKTAYFAALIEELKRTPK